MEKFNVGDVVTLKDTGISVPKMLVENVHQSTGTINCIWWMNSEYKRAEFHEGVLKKA